MYISNVFVRIYGPIYVQERIYMQLFHKPLDRNIPIPLYFQLKNIILEDIKNHHFSVGDAIPTENELVNYYHISRSTVRQAIAELVQEGWLTRQASKGTFVTLPEKHSNSIRSYEPFYQQIQRLGQTPRTELLDLSVITPPDDIAKKMCLKEGEKVISMFRRRFADDTPMVTLQNYIPYELCAFILSYDFKVHSLYELLSSNPSTKIANTQTIVSANAASAEDMKLLNVPKHAPMLYFHNIAVTDQDIVVDYAFSHYRGDLNQFEYNAVP